MIKSFGNKDTEALFSGRCPQKWVVFRVRAERKLMMIHAAQTLEFLASPPGNRLEMLVGKRRGQYSIRINRQWRVCFRWRNGDALDVEIVDYH